MEPNHISTEPSQAESQPNQISNQVPASEAHKSSKAPWVVATITSILAIAGIAFGVYGMMKPAEAPASDNLEVQIKNTDGTTTTLETDKIEKTDDGKKITISDSVSEYSLDRTELQSMLRKMRENIQENMKNYAKYFEDTFFEGTVIGIPDSDYYASSDEAYGIVSARSDDISLQRQIMQNAHIYAESFLADNGFSRTTHPYWPEYPFYYNSNNKTYCQVSEGSFPFAVKCAKETWVTESNKKLALELAKTDEKIKYVSVETSKIEDSSVSPYQRISTNIGPAYGLFYRVSPNSEWHFFTATQAELECSDFTGDVAKAYAGIRCWDSATNQELTVNPDN